MNKDQVKGRAKEVKGKVKEVAGRISGNKDLEQRGKLEDVGGKIQAGYGDLKEISRRIRPEGRRGGWGLAPPRRCAFSTLVKGFSMPQNAWKEKRERQYAHIKDSLLKHGKSEALAEEIAARTVNKGAGATWRSQTRQCVVGQTICRRHGVVACTRIAAPAAGPWRSCAAAQRGVAGRSRNEQGATRTWH